MLSLFKLPFWGRYYDDQEHHFPINGVAQGIFRNYLLRKEINMDEMGLEASQYLEDEFASLHQLLKETPPQDQYDLIQASLWRIDQRLADF